ncbi:MAG: AAA family ATPase, partial [Fluviicola sp.]
LNDEEKRNIIKTVDFFKYYIFYCDALYVPAERAILNLLKQASFGFQLLKIAIPNHLLGYGNLFEIASKNISELNLNFLSKNTSYKFENGVDKIYFSKNENVKLSESASSFQSIIPLLLPIINEKENQNKQYSFVIEEPETNLFPKAQYELMKFLEKDRKDDFGMIDKGSIHTYTTHSPFILSSLNNMLYAYKMGLIDRKNKNIIEKISKIIPEENWIDPNTFSAYEIKNGKAKNIFDRKSGLIKENAIDLISEDIIEDFRKIAIATIE